MFTLNNLGRAFDVTAVFAFIFMSLTLAGATAVVGV